MITKQTMNTLFQIQLFVLLFVSQICSAQVPVNYNLNSENGLPTNEIYRIIQDQKGYIWIGSNFGIYQYNGFDFKNFSNQNQNGRALSFVQEDVKGRIWAKNFFGQIFMIENGVQKLVLNLPTSDPNYPQFVIDNHCNIIIYDGAYIVKYSDKGKKINALKIDGIKPTEIIISLFFYDNSIFVLTDHKSIFRIENTPFKEAKKIKDNGIANQVRSRSHFLVHRSELFVFLEVFDEKHNYLLNKINLLNEKIEPVNFPSIEKNELIHGVYSTGEKIWAFGSNGAFPINNVKNRLFEGHKISHILKDNENVLWFASLDEGLFIVPNQQISKINSTTNNLLENHFTCAKIINQNTAILGTYHGNLYRYNIKDQSITPIHNELNEFFLAVKRIDKYKNFLIVSRGRLCIIDEKTGKQHFTKFSNVRDFSFRGDEIYLVFPQFIAKIKFEDLLKENSTLEIINNDGGKEIEFDPIQNKMIVSLSKGTFWIDERGKWVEIKLNNQSIYASSLTYDAGITWIGTISNGVLGYKGQQLIAHYSIKNKLSENTILNVKSSSSNLWVNTDKYVYRINLKTNKSERLGKNLCVNPTDILNLEIGSNHVFLSTNKAIYTFPSEIPLKNIQRASIKINKIESNGKEISLLNRIELKNDNSNVKFYFSCPMLKNRGDYTVKYRVKGLSDSWENATSESEYIIFPKLPSGKFKFEIKVINPFGEDSKIESISFIVKEPFWKSIWFILFSALLFIALCIYIASLRIKYIKRKSEAKNTLIKSQLTALKSQMNPHFMFNTLNSLQDLMLKQDFKNTNYYLSKYASLLRTILTNSEKNEITIEEEITMLDAYLKLEKLRFGDDFNYNIECSEEIVNKSFCIPPMIIQPFVENAIKHGLLHLSGEKKLKIQFQDISNRIICTVEDNGVGRKKSTEINKRQGKSYQSFSTDATDQRIKLMNEFHQKEYSVQIFDLEETSESTGTKVVISFAKIQ